MYGEITSLLFSYFTHFLIHVRIGFLRDENFQRFLSFCVVAKAVNNESRFKGKMIKDAMMSLSS